MRAYNSTIQIKPCRCGCGKPKKFGYNGYAGKKCMPEDMQQLPKYQKSNVAHGLAVKRADISKKVHEAQNEILGLKTPKNEQNEKLALQVWFLDRRKEMTGICACGCGNQSSKKDNKYWKHSIAHVLMKSKFPSISTNKDNWIELAFWGGCHGTFDEKGYEYCMRTKPALWAKIVQKFKKIYPFIAQSEHQYIPDVLLQEINQI